MTRNGLEHGDWVLICDARKALLVQNDGDRTAPNLVTRERFEHPDRPSHELGTDTPGRLFSARGGRHTATEPTDFQAMEEEAFLKQIAAHLDRNVSGGPIEKLILVAPPRALGILRRSLSPAVHRIVAHEFEKDYVKVPLYEVERHLTHHIAEHNAAQR